MRNRLAATALSLALSLSLYAAEREPLGRGAQFAKQTCACKGVKKKSIFAHPPWKGGAKGRVLGEFKLDLAKTAEPKLHFYTGLRDGHGSKDGVIFRVYVDTQEVWSEFQKDGAWREWTIDLTSHAGRACVLELAVDTMGEHYSCIGEPQVVDRGRVVADLADLAQDARRTIMVMKKVPDDELPESYRKQQIQAAQATIDVRPSERQLAWQQLEFIGFAHFGVNTFTDREWGDGKESEAVFNPTDFDADQWAQVWKDAGMKLLILTCKHHDGFCLWPSKYTEHSVKNSPWRGGKGDVVREVADACRKAGIRFGVYLSPWDRNNPEYGNSPVYNECFRNQLRELMTNYGEISEVWFDGACGEGPNGKKQNYDFDSYYAIIRDLQPQAVIAIRGPDVRWVGNETGVARETEWSVQRRGGKAIWYPAECDVSIRPGWFYHASQDSKVKSLAKLIDIYFKSVGRNSVLLLNIPPDRRGLIHENDHARLKELRAWVDAMYAQDFAQGAKGTEAKVLTDADQSTVWQAKAPSETVLDLAKPAVFNVVELREDIARGQHVEEFVVEGEIDGQWREIAKGTTIGYRRLLRIETATTSRVRVRIMKSRGGFLLSAVALYRAEFPK
jgi:alpha-L-fucosidase